MRMSGEEDLRIEPDAFSGRAFSGSRGASISVGVGVVSAVVHQDVAQVMGSFERSGMVFEAPLGEVSNVEYGAAMAGVGSATVRFRVGKLTPTKAGLFVALWRRAAAGSAEPFPVEEVDALVIAVREGVRFGAFVFSKAVLVERGIVSVDGVGGKRGFRIYPPWSAVTSRQAERSQSWQCDSFLESTTGPWRTGSNSTGSSAWPSRAHPTSPGRRRTSAPNPLCPTVQSSLRWRCPARSGVAECRARVAQPENKCRASVTHIYKDKNGAARSGHDAGSACAELDHDRCRARSTSGRWVAGTCPLALCPSV